MRLRLVLLAAFLVAVAFPPWPARALAATPSPQAEWDTYVNAAYGWSMRYPAGWHVNQGDLGPVPAPITTKFSTYEASAGQKVTLTAADAEVWVTVTEAALAAGAASDFAGQGYAERKVDIAGVPATRYTAAQPAFGLYDAVILVAGGHTYRIYLSASTHAFDAQFQGMLDSLELSAFDRLAGGSGVPSAVTLAEVLAKPQSYKGDVVTLAATFLGQRKPATPQPATAAPPTSPSDWLVQDHDLALYVQAGTRLSDDSLSPDLSGERDAGKRLRITGIVRTTTQGIPYLEPFSIYPELAGTWVRRGGADGEGLALELTQAGTLLSGQMLATVKGGEAAPRPIAGSIIEGRRLRVKVSDAGPAVEIEGTLSADGRSFSGTRTGAAGATEELVMALAEPALPGTGADLSRAPASAVLVILATLLATCGAALALGARRARP